MPKEPMVPAPSDGVPREPGVQPAALPDGIPRIVGGSLESRPRNDHAAEAVLDKLNRGIVIFDPDARVHFLNDSAMRLIRESQAIDVIDSRLVFTEAECQERFVGYLRGCTESAGSSMDQCSIVMRVPAGSCTTPYRVLLSPLKTPANPATGSRDTRHVLMIYEPHAGRQLPLRILTELYGLSEAEAALAELLFEGDSLEAAAQRLHISINTAKTHLHHVFVKCDVHSQGELLQLLSLGPRTL
jgi:DNA-binding CsgD family transcriptional regulator